MWLIPLIVVGVIIWIYWNPSSQLQKKWKKRHDKWDRKIEKIRKERGLSELWKNEKAD